MASRDVGHFFVRCAILSIHSLCLLAPSFIPALFLRSSITLYLSSLLSFTHVSRPSFCRSHTLITRSVAPSIHCLDLLSSVLHSPPLVSSIILLSSALQLTVLGHGATAVQLNLVLLITMMRLSLPPFIIHRRLWHIAVIPSSFFLSSLGPSVALFFCPSALRSLNPSVFMARGHQMHSSSVFSLRFSSTQRRG